MSGRRLSTTVHAGFLIALTIAGSASQHGVSAVDGRGKRLDLAAPPQRIVSLAPSNTEILFALGLKGRIVADTSQCDFPPEAHALPHVGDYRISVEQVLAQKPDLVIAHISANRQAIQQLEGRVPLFALEPLDFRGTLDSIRRIGQITAKTREAEAVVRGMQSHLARIQQIIGMSRAKPRVLIVVQAQPLMVAGIGTFMDDIVKHAGGINASRDARGYASYSPEKVVADSPDVILADPQSVAQIRSRAGWGSLPAVKHNALYSLPPSLFSRPGPRLALAVEELARRLHPEAFLPRR